MQFTTFYPPFYNNLKIINFSWKYTLDVFNLFSIYRQCGSLFSCPVKKMGVSYMRTKNKWVGCIGWILELTLILRITKSVNFGKLVFILLLNESLQSLFKIRAILRGLTDWKLLELRGCIIGRGIHKKFFKLMRPKFRVYLCLQIYPLWSCFSLILLIE